MDRTVVTKWWRPVLVVAAVALAFMIGQGNHAQTASAAQSQALNCMGDVCGVSRPCTANDVRVSLVETWTPITDYCLFAGDTGTYTFRATFVATSNMRYDPGVWIATDGGDAKTGLCYKDYLTPPLALWQNYNPDGGPYWDAEDQPGSGDECGDIAQGVPNYKIIGPITFLCKDDNGDGIIDPIGTCLGWDNNAGNNCPANQNCPGTGSKCRCEYISVEVNLGRTDLRLLKTAPTDPVLPGEVFNYTLQVTNNGPDTSTGFTITDDLDKWLKYVSFSGSGATCEAVADPADPPGWGQIVTCVVTPDLPKDGSYSLTLTVQVHPYDFNNPPPPDDPYYGGPPLTLPNTACVRGNEFDTDTSNDCDDATVTTPVTLAFFEARRSGGSLRFEWATATEAGNAGFNLYVEGSGGRQRINPELIPSKAVTTLEPLAYGYEAAGVKGEAFYLEEVSAAGHRQLYGPFALGRAYGARPEVERIDWAAIAAGHQALAAARAAGSRGIEAASVVELLVARTGLYRVTYEQLLAAGFDFTKAPSAELALINRGEPVPIRVQAARLFGPGAYIEFYGEALDTLYTRTNVYTLRVDANLARRIPADGRTPPPGATPPKTYLETVTVDRNQKYDFTARGDDPWYDTMMTVYTSPKVWSFDLTVDNYLAGGGAATLAVDLSGYTAWPIQPDHHLIVSLNGTQVANEWFDGFGAHPLNVSLPKGVLLNGANSLQIAQPGDTGANWDMVILDKYGVTYPRAFYARDGVLAFESAANVFVVQGLPTNSVVVYRRDAGGAVTNLSKVSVSGVPGDYRAKFAGTGYAATYLVYSTGALLVPQMRAPRPPADITSGTAGYLILSHPDFIDGLGPLVAARQSRDPRVVNVDDVYAQFGYGIFDPQAIRDYIAYAANHMGTQYVLLVGGDTYDYLDYLGLGSISFVPSLYAATDYYARFSPVDPLYTDLNGDNVPDRPIGRLPVRTAAELGVLIAKTLAYEGKDYGATAVFSADDGFASDSEMFVAGLLDGWAVTRAYLDEGGVGPARSALIGALNDGVALTSYVGHSGTAVWTFDGLFNAGDAAALTNYGRPTVVSQWGCWNTYYVSPTYNTLAHKFLLSGDQGAAAVLGSTTISYDASERTLGRILTPRLVQPGMSIGAALQAAKAELAVSQPRLLDVLLGWTILGDPALVVQP